MTGILFHEDFLNHITQIDHPERPGRLTVIVNELKREKYEGKLVWEEPRLATVEEIEYVHGASYIARVRSTAKSSPQYLDSPDTFVSSGSYQAALRAAGAVMTAIDGVLAGRFRRAFCPVRPPGHHARYSQAMGFCIFNNIAIGARYLKRRHNIQKILIVDFDVHHCNGTEEMLGGDTDILLASIHQYPHYPGTGLASKLYTHSGGVLNAPVPPGSDEADFMKVIRGRLSEYVNLFMPEFVLVSAGFDAHRDDPLGDLMLTSDSYYRMTREVVKFAELHCEGKVVSTLEGGYNLRALAESASRHVDALVEE